MSLWTRVRCRFGPGSNAGFDQCVMSVWTRVRCRFGPERSSIRPIVTGFVYVQSVPSNDSAHAGTHSEQLAELLRNVLGSGSFATCHTAPADDLHVEIAGMGQLKLPVLATQVKTLRSIARPAKYGYGEETVLDRRIRDTWEIPRSRVRIDNRRWNRTLRPMLDVASDRLGLGADGSLSAELHSVLLYEPGQFFAPHQDSEKSDDMIGSLVVMLPSRSTGGELVVEHGGEKMQFAGSTTALTFAAFYSDTRHEVLPVKSGNRIVLTYNLMRRGDITAPAVSNPELIVRAADHLHRHFNTRRASRWGDGTQSTPPPDRLIFLLDHRYSQRGLRLSHLKGADASRAAVLAEAAARSLCGVALAQVEIQETWNCHDAFPRHDSRQYRNDWDEDDWDEDEIDEDRLELTDLLDSSVTLTPAPGTPLALDPIVSADELATVTPSVELKPTETEYTGFMGNWGNTVDRWYTRAALVIWPRNREFALLAAADHAAAADRAIDEFGRDQAAAKGMVRELLQFWPRELPLFDQTKLLSPALRLSLEAADPEPSAALLKPFDIRSVQPSNSVALLALADVHGIEWFNQRLAWWSRATRTLDQTPTTSRTAWIGRLPSLIDALQSETIAPKAIRVALADALISSSWSWIRSEIEQSSTVLPPSRRATQLANLSPAVLGVLRSSPNDADASSGSDAAQIRSEVLETLTGRSSAVEPLLTSIVSDAIQLDPSEIRGTGVTELAESLAQVLHDLLAAPDRSPQDWAVPGFDGAEHCEDCAQLASFLADPRQQKMTWPLAKARRGHIHDRIDAAELPLTHRTLRQGSPHKLILTKTDALFAREADRRQTAQAHLADVVSLLARLR